MKNTSKKWILAATVAIIGLIWFFAVVAYTKMFELPWLSWGSIVCAATGIAVAELYLLVFRKDRDGQQAELGALGMILTACFLLVVFLLNSLFVLLKHGNFNWVLLSLNLIVNAGYIIALLWAEHSNAGAAKRAAMTEQKTVRTKEISRKLGELLAIAEDAEVKRKLLKLKEAVDYSTNITTGATAAGEIRMIAQLDELVQLSIGRADRLIILNKIEAAEMTWKMRSSTASSSR